VGLVVALGVALGGVAALGVAPILGSLLFEARASDPLSLGLPLAGLMLASVLSALPAARRAVRVDPMTSLRSE
jgi:ABC-type antimicrobial peptide transport system permease subunit